ncbi:MAG: hypothetical protein PVH98_02840 [Gammaproteobacteria bacterium]
MDSLSSLSNAFGKAAKTNTTIDQGLQGLDIQLDDTGLRAFKEFTSGMRMLHRHSRHNSINVLKITSQNLRLLNTNLKASTNYRKALARITSRRFNSANWCWISLLTNDELNAGLLYIPAGHSVTPGHRELALAMRNNADHTPLTPDANSGLRHRLYLNLAGKPIFEYRQPMAIQYTNRYIHLPVQTTDSCTLRTKEAFSEQPGDQEVQQISTTQDPSLLLTIHLPHE